MNVEPRESETETGLAADPREATRPYLLERVGEAAVVQLYADGFEPPARLPGTE